MNISHRSTLRMLTTITFLVLNYLQIDLINSWIILLHARGNLSLSHGKECLLRIVFKLWICRWDHGQWLMLSAFSLDSIVFIVFDEIGWYSILFSICYCIFIHGISNILALVIFFTWESFFIWRLGFLRVWKLQVVSIWRWHASFVLLFIDWNQKGVVWHLLFGLLLMAYWSWLSGIDILKHTSQNCLLAMNTILLGLRLLIISLRHQTLSEHFLVVHNCFLDLV